jgi:SAM-dependent methyltransferase
MAEFDNYSVDYSPGAKNILKRLLGGGFEVYVLTKVKWFLRDLFKNPLRSSENSTRVLDYGCGTGEFLRSLISEGFSGQIRGCDLSPGMLDTATRRWKHTHPPPFDHMPESRIPYEKDSFEIVTSSCVLHHIMPDDRPAVYDEIYSVLVPGGRLYIFEHNPFHPLTRWAVARAPEDANAVLLKPGELERGLKGAGFRVCRIRHLLIAPPRFPGANLIDSLFGIVPIGGQYALVAEKPRGDGIDAN